MNEIQINTTQNVIINFEGASLGNRILSFLIDFLIIIAYLAIVFYILNKMEILDSFKDHWSSMAIVSVVMLPAMFYTLVSELLMEGQTIGKKAMKLQVIKLDGYQLSGIDYVIRWLFRLVDIYLIANTGVIAILSISFSKNHQRLGGMASGTTVISTKNLWSIDSTILKEIQENYVPVFHSVIKLSDNDMRIITDSYHTALSNNNDIMIAKLRKKIEQTTKEKKGAMSDKKYLNTIIKDYTFFTQNM